MTESETQHSAWFYVDLFNANRLVETLMSTTHARAYSMEPEGRNCDILHVSCGAGVAPHLTSLTKQLLTLAGVKFTCVGGPENCCGAIHKANGETIDAKLVASLALGNYRRTQPEHLIYTTDYCGAAFAAFKQRRHNYHLISVAELLCNHKTVLQPSLTTPIKSRALLHVHEAQDGMDSETVAIKALMSLVPQLDLAETAFNLEPASKCIDEGELGCKGAQFGGIEDIKNKLVSGGYDMLIVPSHNCLRRFLPLERLYKIQVRSYIEVLGVAANLKYVDDRFRSIGLLADVDSATKMISKLTPDKPKNENVLRDIVKTKLSF